MKTLLGIDYGTGGCKVTALGTDGSFVGEASVEYTTYHDHPGWSEQEPQDWWDALCAALRKLKDKGVDLSSVAAAALDGSTHNAVLMDAFYRPVRRTIMWTDQRAVAECAQLRETMGDKIFKTAYQMPAPTWTLPQMMWLRAHEPDVLARTEHVLFVKDYVRYLLTGNAATDRIEAQGTLFFNMAKMDWDEELVQMAGLSPASLPSFIAPTDIAGHVTAAAAAATGLPEGMPVVCGQRQRSGGLRRRRRGAGRPHPQARHRRQRQLHDGRGPPAPQDPHLLAHCPRHVVQRERHQRRRPLPALDARHLFCC